MAKSENQKAKLLYLADMFQRHTDESHGLSIADLTKKFRTLGIEIERKTLYADIDELRRYGMDIVKVQEGRNCTYKLVSRTFELPELKLLVDSVQSAKFITEKKSNQLIKKLESLVSESQAKQLHRQVFISGRVKTMNESIYYNVDKLHDAISSNCQVRFKYFQWNEKKEQVLRHDGEWYCVSPWSLLWDDEYYYLVAYDSEADKIKHYRVDKMQRINTSDKLREGAEKFSRLTPAAYSKSVFGMFGGELTDITLEVANDKAFIFIDRFGKDVLMRKNTNDTVTVHVNAAVSDQFLSWIISLGPGVKITAPADVVDAMKAIGRRITKEYKK